MESAPWVAIGLTATIQLLALAFAAGALWSRMKNLERAVLNGISARLDVHGKVLDAHSEALSAINERCKSRLEVTREIKDRLAKAGA